MLSFLTLRSCLVAWSIAGPILAGGVVYLSMLTRETIVVSGAVRVARGEETIRCNAQRAAIAETINAAARRSVSRAWEAAAGIGVVPSTDVAALCQSSASCRERAVSK